MDKRYWIGLLIFLLTATTNVSVAQFSLGGGVSTFHGINLPVNRVGGNIFLEVPRTPENTLFVRAAYMLPVKNVSETSVSGKPGDRKSTRLNSSHVRISYAVFCLKKKK